jgi:biopolymer transport protein ExbD
MAKGGHYIDFAPLIDCVLLLLLFFMLTSNFVVQPGITIDLPKAITSEVIGKQNLIITIAKNGVVYLEDKPVTLGELKALLAKKAHKVPVLIKADQNVEIGKIVDVWDLCRDVGLSQVNIATNKKE